jgi:hypothetical protein
MAHRSPLNDELCAMNSKLKTSRGFVGATGAACLNLDSLGQYATFPVEQESD